MPNEDQRRRAVQLVAERMAERGYDARRLAVEANIDPDTAKDFLELRRWPQANSRNAIEKALGLTPNIIEAVAAGLYEPPTTAHTTDPVEAAIYRSPLSRANQLKLAGIYYEMLEAQGKGLANTGTDSR